MSRLLLWIAAQIITESFPVSSSSHIKFLEKIFSKMGGKYFLENVPKHFEEFLHIPTLVIFALFFFSRWYPLVRHPMRSMPIFMPLILRTMLASCVTAVWYVVFLVVPMKHYFPVEIGLVITMSMLFLVRQAPQSYKQYTWQRAFILGFVQGLALLPGISRLGSTYCAARWLQLSPRHALEASCAMYIPLLLAAGVRSSFYLFKDAAFLQLLNVPMGLVMLLSSVVAYAGFWLVSTMSNRHHLWWFGYYLLLFIVCYTIVDWI